MILVVLRWALRITGALLALVLLYVGLTFGQVWWASRQNDTAPASAIVVMGAAQWNGVPSPVLRNRLDHAAELYRSGAAPVVGVTGGQTQGDAVTQGHAGYEYLRAQGLPDSAIRVEVDGTNSFEELSASSHIVAALGTGHDVLIVTDPYHAMRVAAIADEIGLAAHVSPTTSSSSFRALFRETMAVAIGRVIGFRRLSSLT